MTSAEQNIFRMYLAGSIDVTLGQKMMFIEAEGK
jgi:hypothetical protein